MQTTNWEKLMQDHEIAYFRGDLATSSPESYSIEEMAEISRTMDASTAEIDAALRADFNSMTPFMQKAMLDMLGAPGSPERNWWERILLDFDSIPDEPPAAV